MTTISAGTTPPTVPALSEGVCLRHDDDLNFQHSAGVVESVGGEIELSRLIASVAMVGSVCERKDQCQTADAIFNSYHAVPHVSLALPSKLAGTVGCGVRAVCRGLQRR